MSVHAEVNERQKTDVSILTDFQRQFKSHGITYLSNHYMNLQQSQFGCSRLYKRRCHHSIIVAKSQRKILSSHNNSYYYSVSREQLHILLHRGSPLSVLLILQQGLIAMTHSYCLLGYLQSLFYIRINARDWQRRRSEQKCILLILSIINRTRERAVKWFTIASVFPVHKYKLSERVGMRIGCLSWSFSFLQHVFGSTYVLLFKAQETNNYPYTCFSLGDNQRTFATIKSCSHRLLHFVFPVLTNAAYQIKYGSIGTTDFVAFKTEIQINSSIIGHTDYFFFTKSTTHHRNGVYLQNSTI